jgi:phosphatidylglycerol:prolipoprotein diacylglycerol transferase
MLAPHLNALSLPGTFRLGPLRFPIYGIFATAGLIAALALSQRTAPRAGLSAQKLWDAGMIAVVGAFLISRLLLVATNFRVFRAFPMLVLTLPSLTYTGMALTAFLTWLYLYFKRIPRLRALDAWAPCALVLAAFLQLGHFFEGTDAGMPTSLPWGVLAPGDTMLGHTHPVQLYALVLDLALTFFLYRRLTTSTTTTGQTTSLALILGGLISFVLAFLRQPSPTVNPLPLDPAQVLAAAAMLTGITLYLFVPNKPEPHYAQ